MTDFVVFSLGCKVNQAEGQSLAETLAKKGFTVSFDLLPARYYILNTCSVTAEADRKSRQAVSRILKLNQQAEIFVIGCSSQLNAETFLELPSVRFVGGTGGKTQALESILLLTAAPAVLPVCSVPEPPAFFEPMEKPYKSRTRAYIKVQDGCNRFCSYCIVPYVRGRSRSRDLNDILAEAKLLAAESKEIILTGVNLSDYRIGGEPGLVRLVREFGQIDAPRKRLGSLGVNIISDELLSVMRDSGFCDHIHLSVQSGSDTVLKRMNRHYTARDILEKVEKIRRIFPNSGSTSDIICGFPGETEQEFAETAETVQKAAFSGAHIFPYSERRGTKAADMQQIEKPLRKQRAAQLSEICKKLQMEFLEKQIGTNAVVYVEENTEGYTSNYCKVYACGALAGEMIDIKLTKRYKDGLTGVTQKGE